MNPKLVKKNAEIVKKEINDPKSSKMQSFDIFIPLSLDLVIFSY